MKSITTNLPPPEQAEGMTEEEKHQMLLDQIAEGLKQIEEGKTVDGAKIFNELLKP